jgi:mono/diheme cytochrome c family protein
MRALMRRARRHVLTVFFLALVIASLSGCNASLPEPESPAARLYQQRCSQCHRLYGPTLLTPEMWTVMVSRMEQEMSRRGVASLKVEEKQTILEYLRKHGYKPS